MRMSSTVYLVLLSLIIGTHNSKKDVPSAVGSCTVRGLGEVISGRSFPRIVQCVEATARTHNSKQKKIHVTEWTLGTG
jgi:hypothetical protein